MRLELERHTGRGHHPSWSNHIHMHIAKRLALSALILSVPITLLIRRRMMDIAAGPDSKVFSADLLDDPYLILGSFVVALFYATVAVFYGTNRDAQN